MSNNAFVFPRPGALGRLVAFLANSERLARIRRACLAGLPFPILESDVRDVVYLNWVVPMERARPLIPRNVQITEIDGRCILTLLTYRHGHFGPRLFGRLRRLFPSPLQSNWRFYVSAVDGLSRANTVLFVRNVFDSILYALGSRLFSDTLPSHYAMRMSQTRTAGGYSAVIEGGVGSAPELAHDTILSNARELPQSFARFFNSWHQAVAILASQSAAITEVSSIHRLAEATIDLPIVIDEVLPAESASYTPGKLLRDLGADTPPFCFIVPAVRFRVLSERLL